MLPSICVTQGGYATRATRSKNSCPPVSPVAEVPAVVGMRSWKGGSAASGWAPVFREVAVNSLQCSPPAKDDPSQSPGARPAAGGALKWELWVVAIACGGGTRALWHEEPVVRGEKLLMGGGRSRCIAHTCASKRRENASSPLGQPPDELSWKHWGKVCLEKMSLETTVPDPGC